MMRVLPRTITPYSAVFIWRPDGSPILVSGSYPNINHVNRKKHIDLILKSDINAIFSLCTKEEVRKNGYYSRYVKDRRPDMSIVHIPVSRKDIHDVNLTYRVSCQLISMIKRGHRIYLHCSTDCERSNIVIAAVISGLMDVFDSNILSMILKQRFSTRQISPLRPCISDELILARLSEYIKECKKH